MAEGEGDPLRGAMEKLKTVSMVSGNLRKDLKKAIVEAMAEITACFKTLKDENECLKGIISDYKVREVTYPDTAHKTTYAEKAQQNTQKFPTIKKPEPTFKMIITPKCQDIDPVKVVKNNLNPVTLGVGVKCLRKLHSGAALIETYSQRELQVISREINQKCNENVDTKVYNKVNPRLIVFNLPEEVDLGNAAEIIKNQNKEIFNENSQLIPKYIGKTKKKGVKYIIIEVDPKSRLQILNQKLKILWNLCNGADYLTVPRCFKCCRYHSNYKDCREQTVCPLCAGSHTLKECQASQNDYKCINCVNNNKHLKSSKKYDEKHPALSRHCPTYLKIIAAKTSNIIYE